MEEQLPIDHCDAATGRNGHARRIVARLYTGVPLFCSQTEVTQADMAGTRASANPIVPLPIISGLRSPSSGSGNISGYIPTLGNLVCVCVVPFLVLSAAAVLIFHFRAKPQHSLPAAQMFSSAAVRETAPPTKAQKAHLMRPLKYPVWCVYEREAVAARDYSPADMPRHLCTTFVYAYATLVRRGRLEPRSGYRDAVQKLKAVAAEPQRDVYLGVAGPRTAAAVASESASSPRYRTQLCGDIEDAMEEEGLQGALFHWPSPYRDSLGSAVVARQFVGAMETCLSAFAKKMALVVPQDEGERNQLFPFLVDDKLSYNVVFWTHNPHRIPGLGTLAHCTVDLPDIVALQAVLKQGAPELHKHTVVTVSLRALRFHLLVSTGPNKLRSADPDKTEVLPYSSVCREMAPNHSQWRWTISKQDGCVHGTYQDLWMASLHDASDVYFANFTTGVALFDMAYDDYQGVCGKKHPLTTMVIRGVNISSVVH